MAKKKGRCICSEHEPRREYGVKFCSNCRKILKYEDHPYPNDAPAKKRRKKK
jgi:hypothetical protein